MELPRITFIQKIKQFSSYRIGYVLVIVAAALAGLIHSISKPLLEYSNINTVAISPVTLAAVIFIVNGLFFTPLQKNTNPVSKIGRKNLLLLTLIGIAEASAVITYFFGLKESTAVNASILTNGEILFSILVAITIFRERLQKKELPPFAMIILGIVLLPVGFDLYNNGMIITDLVYGDLLILLSGAFYALDINLCKYVSNKMNAKTITQLGSFVAGGFALCLIFVFQIPFEISISHLPSIAIIGIFGTGISTFFFIIALRLIGAVRTILLYSTTTVFGVIFAGMILQESITLSHVFSIILVSIGLYALRNRLGSDEKIMPYFKGSVKNAEI